MRSRIKAISQTYNCIRMVFRTSVQWCASKFLTTISPGNKKPWSVVAVNFHGINIPTTVNFKPPTWPHSMQLGRNVKLAPGHQSIILPSSNPTCFTWMGHSTEWYETDRFLLQKTNDKSVLWVIGHTWLFYITFPYTLSPVLVLQCRSCPWLLIPKLGEVPLLEIWGS